MIDRDKHSYLALRKMRTLLCDLLYLKYEDEWKAHDKTGADKVFDWPDDKDKALLAFLLALAEGNEKAVAAIKEFTE